MYRVHVYLDRWGQTNEHQQRRFFFSLSFRASARAFSLVPITPTVFINVVLANNVSNLFVILSFALNVLSSSVECKRKEDSFCSVLCSRPRFSLPPPPFLYITTHKPECQSVLMMKMSLSLSVFYRSTAIINRRRWWWWIWKITSVTWSRFFFFVGIIVFSLLSVSFWQDNIGYKKAPSSKNNLFAK